MRQVKDRRDASASLDTMTVVGWPDPSSFTRDRYRHAVACVAWVLRPRFLRGELRGWREGDGDLWTVLVPKSKQVKPPLFRVETACEELFIKRPQAALDVLAVSRQAGESWDWTRPGMAASLQAVAASRMALDVVAYARRKGWLRTTRRAA